MNAAMRYAPESPGEEGQPLTASRPLPPEPGARPGDPPGVAPDNDWPDLADDDDEYEPL